MVLNAIQKQSSKQSLCKVISEAAIQRFSSKQLFLKTSHGCFLVNIAKIFRKAFLQKTSGGCFIQFDKVTIQHWASANLLFLVKNIMWDGFYKKGLQICLGYVMLLVETVLTRLYCKSCRKQKLVRSKTLQQGLFVQISDLWQFRHSNFS